jgi:hypothetical protein
MRVFPAVRPQQASTLDGLSWALQQYFRVPEDMPDAFVMAFARLDSSEREKQNQAFGAPNPSSLIDLDTQR